ncbi:MULTISPECIES: helix-turn-helix transcriptional regulator [Nocardiopsis]|uniref:Transcriptional regulator, LuxR family n=1 Tax=Nocardiopsis dassonvillei (strain ATCC 23218 / DSM 43111 / CIP 107115 / JCM 7437 / KCTC 9190 / NBRC 14626 / NCTC 10488 / NRRL B-5397 / IMRU 509) TaxID=446468 RepID=D7B0G3_NOCDD|nr:transcriptional regulator, LuxR family [Nocardiopsis dassonvillei subsp. dassonvillei DSM 43111]
MPVLAESRTVFVGRERELRLLRDHARRSHTEASGTVLVSGDAGVGKSRLVGEFVSALPQGTVFVGGCLQLGVDGLSYAPFTAVLRQLLRERGRAAFEAAAPGGTGEFARLLPELGEVPVLRPENRGILFEQVLRLFTQAAEDGGVTVVLEDLHWADGATRDLLVFLVRNLDLPGVQLVATYRSDDLHRTHPLRRLLPELRRAPGVEPLELAPFSREEAGVQAAAIRGADLTGHELDQLYRRTEGVPLFVESLASAVGDPSVGGHDVPDQFRDLLLEPLHRFDDTALSVLRVASVGAVSGSIEHEMLYHAAGLPERELETALHTLVDANTLRADRTGYRFRHALLRDAVHSDLLPGAHARLHMRFAQLIDEYPDSVPFDRRAAEQAHHYNAAQELPSALQAAWWAAVRAGDTLAYGEELDMLERVLALWDRVPDARERVQGRTWAEVASLAAGAAVEAGRARRALELADEALAALPEDGVDDHTLTVRAGLLRRRGLARAADSCGSGITDLVKALELHPPHMPGYGLLLSILARESMVHRADRRHTPEQERLRELERSGRSARALAEEAIALADPAEQSGMCAAADARITLGGLHMDAGDLEGGRPLIEAAIRYAAEIRDPALEARGAGNLGHFLRELGHHEEGLAVLEESLARHEAMGWAAVHKTFNHQNRAEIHFELGDLAKARGILETVLRSHPSSKHRFYVDAVLARTAAAQGDPEAARRAMRVSGRADALASHRMNIVQLSLLALLEADLVAGDVDDALVLAERTLERLVLESAHGYTWPMAEAMAEAARRGAAPDRPEGTAERARRVRDLVAALVAPMPAHGTAQHAYRVSVGAHLSEADGAGPDALLERWRESVAAWEATPMRLHLARARLRAAEAAVAVGRRERAVTWVRQAHATARECGAAPLAGAAADLARRMGSGLEEDAAPPAVPAGLTARETEVARLLVVGSTNAQIAERLFITAKTASVHVSNILAKLDVPNRAAAGVRLRELGLA